MIEYVPGVRAHAEFPAMVRTLIEQHGSMSVCEVGAGANPTIPPEEVAARGLRYAILDVSKTELEKAPAEYRRLLGDVCAIGPTVASQFDFVFSKYLAEHVKDGLRFHQAVRAMLKPGGIAFHFFPTLYSTPFVMNRIMPERLAAAVLDILAPRDKFRMGKFPAYYSMCYGPTRRQLSRLQGIGYDVLLYRGYFGHSYYARLPVIQHLHSYVTRLLLKHPVPSLTSYAYVVMRRVPSFVAEMPVRGGIATSPRPQDDIGTLQPLKHAPYDMNA